MLRLRLPSFLWSRPSIAAACVTYAVVLLVALGAGLGRTESALPPGPENRTTEVIADSGSKLLSGTRFDPLSADALVTVADSTLLEPLELEPQFHIDSTAAYVFDETCGEDLYAKNESWQLPPASLTKIMTALVAVEYIQDLDQVINVRTSASELAEKTGSSVMGLEPDMELTLRDLLYGLMLPSGNDAAIEIAEAVAGDTRSFVALMNQKALELGLTGTRFANPHGLDDPRLRSTARDLVVLGEAMMANPLLAEIAGVQDYVLASGLELRNGNGMLRSYAGAYGVKIGYTDDAAHTIVVAAERAGHRIYASVLGSNIPYQDAAMLLDWAFEKASSGC